MGLSRLPLRIKTTTMLYQPNHNVIFFVIIILADIHHNCYVRRCHPSSPSYCYLTSYIFTVKNEYLKKSDGRMFNNSFSPLIPFFVHCPYLALISTSLYFFPRKTVIIIINTLYFVLFSRFHFAPSIVSLL